MKLKTVTLWHYKLEEEVTFSEKGKTIRFTTAHELIQFLQGKTRKTIFNVRVEQA